MNKPSQSWKEFEGEIKLAVRGEKGEENDPPRISSVFVLPLPLSPFPLLSPFVWERHASFDPMPSTEGSCSGLVPEHQGNKLG